MMGNYYGNMMGWGWGFGFGWIFTVIFWGLIIWGIVSLIRSRHGCQGCGNDHNGSKPGGNAMDILKERYAKGEITKDQFDKMKQDLQ